MAGAPATGPRGEPVLDAFIALSQSLDWAKLSPRTQHMVRRELLDYYGAAVAGRAATGVPGWIQALVDVGGRPDAQVIGGPRVPAHTAALTNGYFGHVLEMDDTHDEAVLHAGAATIPAALAAAEMKGGVSGARFCEAVLLGIELTCRLGVATKLSLVEGGWIYTALLGHFGATLAAARILDPRPEILRNALGIVYCLTSGNHESTREGATTKHMQPGFAAANAITAAMLAAGGLDGVQQPLSGEDGLVRAYLHGRFDTDRALRGLGEEWETERLSIKPYPTCRLTHPAISAALAAREQLGAGASRIERVELLMGEQAFDVVARDIPERRTPRTRIAAQFSVFWTVAAALEYGEVTPIQLASDIPPTPRLAARIAQVSARADTASATRDVGGCTLRAHGPFGVRDVRFDNAKGHPDDPLDDAALRAKFDANLRYARIGSAAAADLAAALDTIDRAPDVRTLAIGLGRAVGPPVV